MKRFDIITESDARILARGETVVLSARAHITPLAMDTLRSLNIAVVREGAAQTDDAALMPVADVRRVAVGSDHTGVKLKQALLTYLRGRGLSATDLGTDGPDPVDYPDVAARVARA